MELLRRAGLRPELASVSPWRKGLDFEARLVRYGSSRYVLRMPLRETTVSDYEGEIDYADVVSREAALYPLLLEAGVPVPRLLAWGRRSAEFDRSWMLLEHVSHDGVAELNPRQHEALGAATRLIHSCVGILEGPGGPGDAESLHERAFLRYRYATRYVDLPPADVVEPLLRVPFEPRVVLHMDLRADNLCFRGDELVGVIDLSNALIGPRHAELGRLRGFGGLTPSFLSGYGTHDVDERLVLAHSVDALGLMVALAVEELHDPAMLAATGERLRETVRLLACR